MGTNLLCNTCGNELHVDAEACWRCGSFTERGLEKEQERQKEEEKRVELQQIDAELRAEYEKNRDDDADVEITWGNADSWLSWEGGGEAQDQDVAPASQWIQIIRKLRELVGEEPEPAVLPSAARRLLAELIIMGIIFVGLIFIVVLDFIYIAPMRARFTMEESPIERDLWLIIMSLISLPIVAVSRVRAVRKFGNLKRELRWRRREALARLSKQEAEPHKVGTKG